MIRHSADASEPPRHGHPSPNAQGRLSERDQEALRLAHDLHTRMTEWIRLRGVTARPVISPFIDPHGQPSVLIRLNSYLARAMVLSFIEVSAANQAHSNDDGPHDRP